MGDLTRHAIASLAAALLLAAALRPAAAAGDKKTTASRTSTTSSAPQSTSTPKLIFDTPLSTPAVPQWKLNQQRETLFRDGQKLVQQGLWREALEKFRVANEMRSDPRLLLWMGYPEEQLGELLGARTLYTQAKKDAQEQKLKQEEQDADAALTALAEKIPHLVIHLPESPKAAIYLGSARVTLEGDQIDVDPGNYKVSVVWPNRPPYQTDVVAMPGQTKTIEVVLTEPAPEPPEPPVERPPPMPPSPAGCMCRQGAGDDPASGTAALAAIGLGAAFAVRRRRPKS